MQVPVPPKTRYQQSTTPPSPPISPSATRPRSADSWWRIKTSLLGRSSALSPPTPAPCTLSAPGPTAPPAWRAPTPQCRAPGAPGSPSARPPAATPPPTHSTGWSAGLRTRSQGSVAVRSPGMKIEAVRHFCQRLLINLFKKIGLLSVW